MVKNVQHDFESKNVKFNDYVKVFNLPADDENNQNQSFPSPRAGTPRGKSESFILLLTLKVTKHEGSAK